LYVYLLYAKAISDFSIQPEDVGFIKLGRAC